MSAGRTKYKKGGIAKSNEAVENGWHELQATLKRIVKKVIVYATKDGVHFKLETYQEGDDQKLKDISSEQEKEMTLFLLLGEEKLRMVTGLKDKAGDGVIELEFPMDETTPAGGKAGE